MSVDYFQVPFVGTLVLSVSMVCAAYTFAVAVAAGRGRPGLLLSARYGTYATGALVCVAVLLLAYAFQTHDFRIRYVARYSDRSMPWWYLVTSLWGGQDGSLLWWSFLLSGWTVACTRWMRGRFFELQPWVLATLMALLLFFHGLMLFASNPFTTNLAVTPPDGEGLNPLLQNYWMTIHPPTLYMGFIGWSIPFAFCIAALITGRLHDEWIVATRKWMLASWLFLSVGLLLGMLWSYEELGWGGYWAWDPVENASFMPWLVGTAFLHSIVIQERYSMLKVWNVFLMCLTFFMTIFGTFLTRAGLISSVHSFAKSDIGLYFLAFMVFLIIFCFGLIGYRTPELRGVHKIQSMVSREFAFLLNNWILLAMMFVVLVLTTWPLVSELIRGAEVTVGPPVYNRFMVPFGVVLLLLSGIGPLISWRKATGKNLLSAFLWPTALSLATVVLHVLLGDTLGFAPWVDTQPIYATATGDVLRVIFGISPVLATGSAAFVVATIAQEFWRGARVRMKNKGEQIWTATLQLVARARRRYGGYIVHLGIVVMFVGFAGSCYDEEHEASLRPGQTMEVGTEGLLRSKYSLRYEEAITTRDENKHALTTRLAVTTDDGTEIGTVVPAKFVYRTHPNSPTTEVAIRSGFVEDLYVIMSTVDPASQRATFRVIVRPLVLWVWLGGLVLIFGTMVAMWPTAQELLALNPGAKPFRLREVFAWLVLGAVLSMIVLFPVTSRAQDTSSLHAGSVSIQDPQERALFERLLCMCGDCQRLSLATCGCSWADDMRAEVRGRVDAGDSASEIEEDYRDRFGAIALSIPPDQGMDRLAWALPVAAAVLSVAAVLWIGLRWRREDVAVAGAVASPGGSGAAPSQDPDPSLAEYDSRIDAALEEDEDAS